MKVRQSGFQELPHTADWAMRVWAGDLPTLFCEAAHGMYSLAGVRTAQQPQVRRIFKAEAVDAENLLVCFLSELVYLMEQKKLAFEDFKVSLNGSKLEVAMSGYPIRSLDKSIKAVTYHNLHILKTKAGFQVEIVFDV